MAPALAEVLYLIIVLAQKPKTSPHSPAWRHKRGWSMSPFRVSIALTNIMLAISMGSGYAAAQSPQCSIHSIPRWSVESHRWSNGIAGTLTSVDFAAQKTGGGTSMTVKPKPNGVEFSFVSGGSSGVGRTFSHDMTYQMRDGKCIMSGTASMFPGNATASMTMVPR